MQLPYFQHVNFPTHNHNHILNLFNTTSDSSLALSVSSTHLSLYLITSPQCSICQKTIGGRHLARIEGVRIEAPRAPSNVNWRREGWGTTGAEGIEYGEGYPPPQWGWCVRRRLCPSQKIFIRFLLANDAFWWTINRSIIRRCITNPNFVQIGRCGVETVISGFFNMITITIWYAELCSAFYPLTVHKSSRSHYALSYLSKSGQWKFNTNTNPKPYCNLRTWL